jgi:cell division initiation protein
MDNAQPAPSVLETLRTVEFRLGLKGYNVDEVDEYLEKAAVEAEGMQEQLRQANERLRQASERIAQLDAEKRTAVPVPVPVDPVADETLQRTLVLAQKFVEQTKRESEAEAAELISEAEDRARATVAQAEEAARKLTSDTEQRLREEVARLEAMRGQLAGDVENMARHLEAERNRLRTALAEVLKWVDDNVQPAAALMAMRPRGADAPRPAARPAEPPVARPAEDPAGNGAPAEHRYIDAEARHVDAEVASADGRVDVAPDAGPPPVEYS